MTDVRLHEATQVVLAEMRALRGELVHALTAERLRELLHFDPGTGVFLWRSSTRSTRAGAVAGYIKGEAYRAIQIAGRLYLAHRLAWLYVTGSWPKDQVDHIDRDRSNNKFNNLREATQSQNNANTLARAGNASGYKGVCRVTRSKTRKWGAWINIDGERAYLGSFTTPEAAHAAYSEAAKHYYGEFARAA